jgi:GT2 family glycosyltransferase
MMSERKFLRIMDDAVYRQWISEFDELTHEESDRLEEALASVSRKPSIGVVPIALGRCDPYKLHAFTQRLNAQVYPNWHASWEDDSAQAVVTAATQNDFVLPLPLDAFLHRHALARFILALAEAPDAELVYADEDRLIGGKRSKPQFKTDWDRYFILGKNSVGVPALYRSEAILRAGARALPITRVDNFLHALTLRVSAVTSGDRIHHIPSVLCHRTEASDWSGAEAACIVREHLAASGDAAAEVSPAPLASQFNRVRFPLPTKAPRVSIIIPTRDSADLIGPCIDGILTRTDYPSIELIIVDNGTTAPDALSVLERAKINPCVRVLRDDRPFNFSRLTNSAAKIATGEILLLLNNDTNVIHSDWLTELTSLASRPDVGVVGARLLYPDFRVQHAGVCFGKDKEIYHQMRLARRCEAGAGGELALLRSAWAVTGACLAVRKRLFFDVGGLNEEDFSVAYNDIDLCRKIERKSLAILCTPFAELLHYESVSRGLSITPEKASQENFEAMLFWSRHHGMYEQPDPFYNAQIEYKRDCVDFARPPRPNRFRPEFRARRPEPFFY